MGMANTWQGRKTFIVGEGILSRRRFLLPTLGAVPKWSCQPGVGSLLGRSKVEANNHVCDCDEPMTPEQAERTRFEYGKAMCVICEALYIRDNQVGPQEDGI